jgi:hypothetical protein
MGRCFLLGAGFSNAVAGLPAMRQLASEFKTIQDREHKAGHENRTFWGEQITQFLDELEDEFFRKLLNIEGGESYERCTFRENLESIVSFIDLNLSGEIRAEIIRGENRSDFSKDMLFWNRTDLKGLRDCLKTYVYLALIGPRKDSALLGSFIDNMLPGDTIVTFNYDLVVESALFRRRLWCPNDGYGIRFENIPPADQRNDVPTKFLLNKIHGSLNWEGPDMFQPQLELEFFYDDGTPIFPGYLKDERPRRGLPFQGGHGGCWMMPSFVKQFAIPELLQVWENAFAALKKADSVVAVGYSLPPEDSAACLLLGTTDLREKSLTLVNRNSEKLVGRYMKITSHKDTAIKLYTNLEDYLKVKKAV